MDGVHQPEMADPFPGFNIGGAQRGLSGGSTGVHRRGPLQRFTTGGIFRLILPTNQSTPTADVTLKWRLERLRETFVPQAIHLAFSFIQTHLCTSLGWFAPTWADDTLKPWFKRVFCASISVASFSFWAATWEDNQWERSSEGEVMREADLGGPSAVGKVIMTWGDDQWERSPMSRNDQIQGISLGLSGRVHKIESNQAYSLPHACIRTW